MGIQGLCCHVFKQSCLLEAAHVYLQLIYSLTDENPFINSLLLQWYLIADDVILVPLRFREWKELTPVPWDRCPIAISMSSSEKGWLVRSSSRRLWHHFCMSTWMPLFDATMALLLKYSPQYKHSRPKNIEKAGEYMVNTENI